MIVTLTTAGLCGLVLLILSFRVVRIRQSGRVSMGDGGDALLLSRIRAHANFSEYVPIILILMGLIEGFSGSGPAISVVGVALVLFRIAHAAGMARPAPNALRVAGTLGTFIILGVTSLWALVLSAHIHRIF